MKTRKPRTIEQHLEWARRVRLLREEAAQLAHELRRAFPLTHPAVRAGEKALRTVEALRSPLENALAGDLGEEVLGEIGFVHYREPRAEVKP